VSFGTILYEKTGDVRTGKSRTININKKGDIEGVF